jgi:hypothetical protein
MTNSKKRMIKDELTTARLGLLNLVDPFADAEWATAVYSEEQQWSVVDILRHLTGAEASMTRLIELIRDGGDGVPADFDLQRWNARGIQKAGNKLPDQLIAEMSLNRARLFETIDGLQDDDWIKSGRHGSLRIMTIEEILNLIADHEMQHTQDIREAVTK